MSASFSLSIVADNDDIRVGDEVEYTITAMNTGDVLLTTPILCFVVDGHTKWTYISNNANLYHYNESWEYLYGNFAEEPYTDPPTHPKLYSIDVGETFTLKIKLQADEEGIYSHYLAVFFYDASAPYDIQWIKEAVNIISIVREDASSTPPIPNIANITITKTTANSPTSPERNVTFNIVVENTGEIGLDEVVVIDMLPPEMIYISDDMNGEEVLNVSGVSSGIIVWNLTNLRTEESITIHLVAQFKEGTDGTFIDRASTSGTGGEGFEIKSKYALNDFLHSKESEIETVYALNDFLHSKESEILSEHEVITISEGQVLAEVLPFTNIGTTFATINGKVIRDGAALCAAKFGYVKPGEYIATETTWSDYLYQIDDIFSHSLSNLVTNVLYWGSVAIKNANYGFWGSFAPFFTCSPSYNPTEATLLQCNGEINPTGVN